MAVTLLKHALSLILSRQVGVGVTTKLSRAHLADPAARLTDDLAMLADEKFLAASLVVPDAAGPMEIVADLMRRTVTISMRLRAPTDKKTTTARLNWLLRQLKKVDSKELVIRLYWPGRGAHTQHTLDQLRDDSTIASVDREHLQVSSFEVCLVRDLGNRFGQSKNFIKDLEQVTPDFYSLAGESLKAWHAPAPKIRDERPSPESVAPKALEREFDAEGAGNQSDDV